jgi:DNA-binding protein HU-beta
MPKSTAGKADDRLMTIKEVARYLHLRERTVLKLAKSEKLPAVQIDKQWRFKRDAIDSWLQQEFRVTEALEDIPDGTRIPLRDLLPEDGIIHDLQAKDALGAIEELAARAYLNHWLNDKPWFVGAVVEREALASTAMEGGVAFMHTRSRDTSKVAQPFIIVGRSYKGLDLGAPDGKPTFLIFLLGLKYDKLHLPILGRLARALMDPKAVAKLRSSPSAMKMRAELLKLDDRVMKTTKSAPVEYESVKPELDRQMRLRAIMRLTAMRKHQEKKAAAAKRKEAEKAEKAAAKKKKAATKKAATKKAATKKAATKKAATKKTTAKKAPAKKTAAKKTTAKKAPAKKTAAKKTTAKKTTAKKAPAKKKTATRKKR